MTFTLSRPPFRISFPSGAGNENIGHHHHHHQHHHHDHDHHHLLRSSHSSAGHENVRHAQLDGKLRMSLERKLHQMQGTNAMCQLHFSLLGRRSPEHVEYEKNSQWRRRRRARWVFTESPLYARHSQGAHYSRFWNSRPLFSWNNVVTILCYFLHIHIFTILLQFSLSLFNTGRSLFSFQPSLVLDLLFVTRSSVERQLFKSSNLFSSGL